MGRQSEALHPDERLRLSPRLETRSMEGGGEDTQICQEHIETKYYVLQEKKIQELEIYPFGSIA
jgi:hypothetical protein